MRKTAKFSRDPYGRKYRMAFYISKHHLDAMEHYLRKDSAESQSQMLRKLVDEWTELRRYKEEQEKQLPAQSNAKAINKVSRIHEPIRISLGAPILVCEGQLVIIFANDFAARLFGYDHTDELIGVNLINIVAEASKQIVSVTASQNQSVGYTAQILRKDNGVISVFLEIQPIKIQGKIFKLVRISEV